MKCRGISRMSVMVAIALSFATAHANQFKSADDLELEARVSEAQAMNKTTLAVKSEPKLTLKQLQQFWSLQGSAQKNCQNVRQVLFKEKYVLTYDAENQPCRIYDLSFPNIQALMSNKSLLQVPVRKLTSRDYLDALDQNWAAIQQRNQEFAKNFDPKTQAINSFIAQLQFQKTPHYVRGSVVQGKGLPISFNLSDVQLKSQFQLSQAVQNDFRQLVQKMDGSQNSDLYRQLADNPELMLKAVRFDWNELDKVYDVILDGRFLPFLGPVEVMNFQQQYRAPVEKLTRQILGELLSQLSRLVPEPTTAAIVEVVIDDVFEQIEMMYRYQALRLEQTLLTLTPEGLREEDFQVLSTRGIHLFYGQQTDMITGFITSVLQGQEFDWTALEKYGSANRYTATKQRKIMMSQMHSRLVLQSGCDTEILSDYFAVCSKKGERVAVYSLLSEQSIPFKSFGAPKVFDYKRPSSVAMIRGGLWVLSAGLRVVGLPISRQATYWLNGYIKGYMHSGILDEALLQSDLLQKNSKAILSADQKTVMDWLYIQNLNPFLPKSFKSESNMIQANKYQLGKIEE